MSNNKTALWIVVILVIFGLIWWGYSYNHSKQAMEEKANMEANSLSATTLSSGNSNDDLSQDMSKVDAQMKGLDQDSASVDQSVNSNY